MKPDRSLEKRRGISAGIIITFGIVWGVWETAIPLILKTKANGPLLGAAMAGAAFFFLSGARHAGGSRLSPLFLFLIAAGIKTLGVTLARGFSISPAITGPLAALLLQALIFAALLAIPSQSQSRSRRGTMITGAAAGLFAALLFPFFSFLLGWKACLLPGTSLPASMVYAPMTMAVAAVSTYLGRSVGIRAQRIPVTLISAPRLTLFILNLLVLSLALALHQ